MKDLYAVLSASDSCGHRVALMSIVKAAKDCSWFPDHGVEIQAEHYANDGYLRVIVKMPEGFEEPSQQKAHVLSDGVAVWFSPSPFGFANIGEA